MFIEKNYVSVRTAARILGLPEYRLREWRRMGQLPGFYAGSWFYVDVLRLQAALDAGTIGAEPSKEREVEE